MKKILLFLLILSLLICFGGCDGEEASVLDEIDGAIMLSIQLAEKSNTDSRLSSISPRDSEAIKAAMANLSAECYPELWRQACEEPAYRAQKLVALEMFLGISFDDLGLYDATAQKIWYDSFLDLREQLKGVSTVSAADADKYGNLLLPLLSEKAENGTLSNEERSILISALENVGQEQEDKILAIEQILDETYEWVQ